MPRLRALTACTILVLSLGAAPALAAKSPGGQRGAIRAGALALFPKKDRGKWLVQHVRISSAGKRWAMAFMNPKRRYRARLQSFIVVLLEVPGLSSSFHWIVADLGSSFVGCGVAPLPVLRDLNGGGTSCPPDA